MYFSLEILTCMEKACAKPRHRDQSSELVRRFDVMDLWTKEGPERMELNKTIGSSAEVHNWNHVNRNGCFLARNVG